MTKKLAVLGATGGTGQHLVKLALAQGHEVVALCRDPSRLPINHEKLQAVKADIFSVDSLKSHFTGCDAVFCCLGLPYPFTWSEVTFHSESTRVTIQAMGEAGVRRYVCMTSWNTDYRRSDPSTFFMEWILKPFMRLMGSRVLDDMLRMESYLMEDCPDINYTIVRPPGLTNGPLTGKTVECELEVQNVTTAGFSRIWMSRADVANFMLSTLDTPDYDRKAVATAV